MKLKIISDGTVAGTRLVDEDSGQSIGKISKISWGLEADSFLSKTTIEIVDLPVEIISKAKI